MAASTLRCRSHSVPMFETVAIFYRNRQLRQLGKTILRGRYGKLRLDPAAGRNMPQTLVERGYSKGTNNETHRNPARRPALHFANRKGELNAAARYLSARVYFVSGSSTLVVPTRKCPMSISAIPTTPPSYKRATNSAYHHGADGTRKPKTSIAKKRGNSLRERGEFTPVAEDWRDTVCQHCGRYVHNGEKPEPNPIPKTLTICPFQTCKHTVTTPTNRPRCGNMLQSKRVQCRRGWVVDPAAHNGRKLAPDGLYNLLPKTSSGDMMRRIQKLVARAKDPYLATYPKGHFLGKDRPRRLWAEKNPAYTPFHSWTYRRGIVRLFSPRATGRPWPLSCALVATVAPWPH